MLPRYPFTYVLQTGIPTLTRARLLRPLLRREVHLPFLIRNKCRTHSLTSLQTPNIPSDGSISAVLRTGYLHNTHMRWKSVLVERLVIYLRLMLQTISDTADSTLCSDYSRFSLLDPDFDPTPIPSIRSSRLHSATCGLFPFFDGFFGRPLPFMLSVSFFGRRCGFRMFFPSCV